VVLCRAAEEASCLLRRKSKQPPGSQEIASVFSVALASMQHLQSIEELIREDCLYFVFWKLKIILAE
jgi:hypothetical protein